MYSMELWNSDHGDKQTPLCRSFTLIPLHEKLLPCLLVCSHHVRFMAIVQVHEPRRVTDA